MGFGPFSSDSQSSTKYTALTDQAKGAVGKKSKIIESGAVEIAEGSTLLQPGSSQLTLGSGSQYSPHFVNTTNVQGVSTDDLKGVLAIQQAGLNASLQTFAGNLANQTAAEKAATAGTGETLGEKIASSIGAVNVPATTRGKFVLVFIALVIFGGVVWLFRRKAT